jgi:hypothetical protein
MKVERKEKVVPIPAITLESGDCFEFEEGTYMVIEVCTLEAECPECGVGVDGDDIFCRYSSVIAICFNDDCIYKFTDEIVMPIKLKVVEM